MPSLRPQPPRPPMTAPPTDATAAAPPRMRADARRNRERIIEAARTVFAEQGADAQMDDVAAVAGVGVGTVYRHFATKDALIGELLTQKFERILGMLTEAREAGGDPGEALLASLANSANSLERDLAVQHVLSGPQKPEVWAAAEPALRQMNAISEELIAGGKATGTLRADMQVSDIRIVMCGVAATMADPGLNPMWRRHLELVVDSLRARP